MPVPRARRRRHPALPVQQQAQESLLLLWHQLQRRALSQRQQVQDREREHLAVRPGLEIAARTGRLRAVLVERLVVDNAVAASAVLRDVSLLHGYAIGSQAGVEECHSAVQIVANKVCKVGSGEQSRGEDGEFAACKHYVSVVGHLGKVE